MFEVLISNKTEVEIELNTGKTISGTIERFDPNCQFLGVLSPTGGYYLPLHAITAIKVPPNEDGSYAVIF